MLSTMVRRWRTFRSLTRAEQQVVLTAGLCLPVVGSMLWLFGFARSQAIFALLTPGRSNASDNDASGDRARETARMIRLAADRGLYHATCLPQSLLLWLLLRRGGIPVVVRFGVRKGDTGVEAHAWVEHNGTAINDDEAVHERFTPFDRAVVS